ncbi:hypothetical protein QYM41_03720 [Kocuria sp. CPCC 205268]|uniref:hypothetical protein n=1 Tax=Kocuria oxytropis TaxID=3058913 RepID=UPI0034D74D41
MLVSIATAVGAGIPGTPGDGQADELPDGPGPAQRWGRRVIHCPSCHGIACVADEATGVEVAAHPHP